MWAARPIMELAFEDRAWWTSYRINFEWPFLTIGWRRFVTISRYEIPGETKKEKLEIIKWKETFDWSLQGVALGGELGVGRLNLDDNEIDQIVTWVVEGKNENGIDD